MSKEDIYDYGEAPTTRTRKHLPTYRDGAKELLNDLDDPQIKAKLRKIVLELFNEWLSDLKKKTLK